MPLEIGLFGYATKGTVVFIFNFFFSGIIFPRFSNEVLAVILSLILQQIIPPDLTIKTRIDSDSLPFLCFIMS